VRRALKIVRVERMEEVLEVALLPPVEKEEEAPAGEGGEAEKGKKEPVRQ